jgi:hypothetical protein
MAENPVEPSAPGSDKTPGVTPNDANASPPKVDTGKETGASNTGKETGASNPDTPDPTKNKPGAESKNWYGLFEARSRYPAGLLLWNIATHVEVGQQATPRVSSSERGMARKPRSAPTLLARCGNIGVRVVLLNHP